MDGENCTAFTRVWDLSGIVFQKVCSGWDSSAAISEKNIVYLWGSNMYGQLGLPCDEFPKSIRPIQLELKANDISMGLRHTVLLDVNGNVWTTGNGKRGQLGLGSEITNLDRFQKIECINNIDSIACGQHHTLAWSARNKTLYSWGDNTHGQLGETTDSSKIFNPLKITIFQDFNIVQIYAGWTNSAILLKNGDAIYWGRNNYGQLGIEDIQEKNFNTINFKGKSIIQLALGSEHSICLLDDNTLWAWGWNEHGNTGTGSSIDLKEPKKVNTNNIHISSIAAGAGHNFIINNDI